VAFSPHATARSMKNAVAAEVGVMARRSDRDDPLSEVRRLLRGLRGTPSAQRGTPSAQRGTALRGSVQIALFRLPSRQEAIVRRYDLNGERASKIQSDLGLSPRQFFRDRRAGLALLSSYIFEPQHVPKAVNVHAALEPPCEAGIAARAFARSLAQSGDARCLDVLRELAAASREPVDRADLLLELAETAADCSDEEAARQATGAASLLVTPIGETPAGELLRGRLARMRARLSQSLDDAHSFIVQALTILRASFAGDSSRSKSVSALVDTLGDAALLHFSLGAYARARAASLEAVGLIDAFGLRTRPKTLEILAMNAAIEACVGGRTCAAIAEVASLLRLAVDSGWSSTACRLGADVVGLNAICGDYDEAIRWYQRLMPFSQSGARPSDRANLAMEAAHSYTMAGRAREALAILGYVRPENGCPRNELPSWHAVTGAALANLGNGAAAIAEARSALSGYESRGVERGVGDAHHLLAVCHARRGDERRAREHIGEARRLVQRYGVPYALLLTLVSEASIVRSPAARNDAIEYGRLLQRLARS
jgi:tetratricopeptide (TPR) repeat protein